jgi:hypothetical protein
VTLRSLPEGGRDLASNERPDRLESPTPLDLGMLELNPRLSRRGFMAAAAAAGAAAWLAACGTSGPHL